MSEDPKESLGELVRATRRHVESLRSSGHRLESRRPKPRSELLGAQVQAAAPLPVAGQSLEQIREDLGDCTRCKLHSTRTQIVFGVGNPQADLVIVGEAPGRDEDLRGEPFVGRAGKLLTDILAAIGLSRDDVYICNVVKCRPPENRNPEPDEIAACSPYLRAQIRSIRPKLLCTLGKFAAHTLSGQETPISRMRGNYFDFEGIPTMVTYHPAYLLRNPSAKKDVWEDMKKLHEDLCRLTGKSLPRKGK